MEKIELTRDAAATLEIKDSVAVTSEVTFVTGNSYTLSSNCPKIELRGCSIMPSKNWHLQNDADISFEKFDIRNVRVDNMSKTISMRINNINNDDDVVRVALLKWINKFSGKPEGQYTRETYLNLTKINAKGEVLYRVLCKNLRLQSFQIEIENQNYSCGTYCLEFGATNIDLEFPE